MLREVIGIAQQAGEIIATYFDQMEACSVEIKADNSPVTQADVMASRYIVDQLTALDPTIPVVSEENALPAFDVRQTWQRYWLVDPLDGTRGFIQRLPEFCINIALIENHRPVLGVIYAPIQKVTTYACDQQGAWIEGSATSTPNRISVNNASQNQLRLLCGHSKRNPEIRKVLENHFSSVALTELNSALKFSELAQGQADLYVRLAPTSEWDTASGQCILAEAGGVVVDLSGNPLRYNAKKSILNPSFLAMTNPAMMDKYLSVLQAVI